VPCQTLVCCSFLEEGTDDWGRNFSQPSSREMNRFVARLTYAQARGFDPAISMRAVRSDQMRHGVLSSSGDVKADSDPEPRNIRE
jgi:hypothetical protein